MLFRSKEIIAPILAQVIPEYQGRKISEVKDLISVDTIKSDAVDDVSAVVVAEPTEMDSISDKLIRYDVRFIARNPILSENDITVFLHIDIEIQNQFYPKNPSYPLIKRALYYAARELSSQLGVLTDKTNYADLEKVYSVWICNGGVPKNMVKTISMYNITENSIVGNVAEPKENYDLATVIIIRRDNKDTEVGKEISVFDYLNAIFTSNRARVQEYIGDEEEILKEVEKMGGFGDLIAAQNREEGFTEGHAKGIAEGIEKGIEKGESRFADLIKVLMAQHRYDDAARAAADKAYRRQLMQEFNLLPQT